MNQKKNNSNDQSVNMSDSKKLGQSLNISLNASFANANQRDNTQGHKHAASLQVENNFNKPQTRTDVSSPRSTKSNPNASQKAIQNVILQNKAILKKYLRLNQLCLQQQEQLYYNHFIQNQLQKVCVRQSILLQDLQRQVDLEKEMCEDVVDSMNKMKKSERLTNKRVPTVQTNHSPNNTKMYLSHLTDEDIINNADKSIESIVGEDSLFLDNALDEDDFMKNAVELLNLNQKNINYTANSDSSMTEDFDSLLHEDSFLLEENRKRLKEILKENDIEKKLLPTIDAMNEKEDFESNIDTNNKETFIEESKEIELKSQLGKSKLKILEQQNEIQRLKMQKKELLNIIYDIRNKYEK